MGLNDTTQTLSYAEWLSDDYMWDDGVITYAVSSKRTLGDLDPIDSVFDRLELETGIRHERVEDPLMAEIDIAYTTDPIIFDQGRAAGYNQNRLFDSNLIVVDETVWHWESTMTHEIGHALGLDHDHGKTGSIMSYERDRTQTWFNDQDLGALTSLYAEWIM